MSNYKEIQKKSDKDLVAHVAEKREEARKFRFNVAGAGTRNVRAVRNAKKEIARSLTELNTRSKKTESNENSK